jgi:hypothetical protein
MSRVPEGNRNAVRDKRHDALAFLQREIKAETPIQIEMDTPTVQGRRPQERDRPSPHHHVVVTKRANELDLSHGAAVKGSCAESSSARKPVSRRAFLCKALPISHPDEPLRRVVHRLGQLRPGLNRATKAADQHDD